MMDNQKVVRLVELTALVVSAGERGAILDGVTLEEATEWEALLSEIGYDVWNDED